MYSFYYFLFKKVIITTHIAKKNVAQTYIQKPTDSITELFDKRSIKPIIKIIPKIAIKNFNNFSIF